MTEMLYLEDSYAKEADAKVVKADGKFIVLDKSIFYPNSGGQPADEGKITCGDAEYKVVFARKIGDDISVEVDKEGLEEGDEVHCKVDWERRYALMRNHTAAHILADVIERDLGALITGNQLGLEKSRIDFNLEEFDKEKIGEYVERANHIIEKSLDVNISDLPKDEAFRIPEIFKLKGVLPPSVDNIRLVDIKGINRQACGGTHVKNTSEIGKIELLKADNRGKDNRRIYFKLVQ